jgi:hypothetical protein
MLQWRGPAELADAGTPAAASAGGSGNGAPGSSPEDEADAEDEGEGGEDQDKPPPGRHGHEDKVGLVLTVRSPVCQTDPCPEVPATSLDAERVAQIVRGLKKAAPLKEDDQPQPAEAEESEPEQAEEEEAEYQGPQWEKRQVVASRQSGPLFGAILATAAWLAGNAGAKRKAFVAEGARAIGRVGKARFRSSVPVLDFLHALSYVYSAAKARGGDAVAGWLLDAEWVAWVWQGKVGLVIEKLQEWQSPHGKPEKAEAEASPRSVVAKALRYRTNDPGKRKYDEDRQQGLPIVSSLRESLVKQVGRRGKGTEKFWGEEGAEAIWPLRADYLSDGDVREGFWQRRQAAATGQRTYRIAI